MTNFESVLTLISAEYQRLETAWQELSALMDVAGQSGVNLDRIGRLVGVLRGGRDDATFRTVILAAFSKELSGTTEQIITYLRDVLGYDEPITLTTEQNGTVFVESAATPASIEALEAVAPAGVALLPADYLCTASGENIVTMDGQKIMVVAGTVEITTVEDTLLGGDIVEDSTDVQAEEWIDTADGTMPTGYGQSYGYSYGG